jgi:tetratricopeptide (TPR) repeat protein
MTTPLSTLNQQELLKLAIDATYRQDGGMALAYLKEATSRTDSTAAAHFLLGSQYAQIQIPDAAVSEMEAAIAMDPGLNIARFQLGLLLLSFGNTGRATDVLTPLAAVGRQDALAHFAQGLLHLIRDDLPETVRQLSEGIKLNSENAALNKDMQRILDEIIKLPAQQLVTEPRAEEESGTPHVFISAYTGKSSH